MAKIYVIDDDPSLSVLIKTILDEDNHDVTIFPDAEEGLNAIRQSPPELVLVDVMMPKLDGYSFCQALQQEPSLAQLPVIVVTAKASIRESFKEFPNVSAFLDKPFKRIVLSGMVERALRPKN
jgi:DNA-binding response OmpR family regulator